jgi:F0F1-type ATP synthase assembly protein I
MPDRPPRTRALSYVIALSQVGLEMVVPIVLGILLDRWLGTVPWLLVAGVLIGLFGGLAHMMMILNRMDRSNSQQPPQTPS